MNAYRSNRRRRSTASRAAEGTLVALLFSIVAVLTTVLYVAFAAAPLVIVALVLHWLGAFQVNYRRATEHAAFALFYTAVAILYLAMVVWGCVGLVSLVVHF